LITSPCWFWERLTCPSSAVIFPTSLEMLPQTVGDAMQRMRRSKRAQRCSSPFNRTFFRPLVTASHQQASSINEGDIFSLVGSMKEPGTGILYETDSGTQLVQPNNLEQLVAKHNRQSKQPKQVQNTMEYDSTSETSPARPIRSVPVVTKVEPKSPTTKGLLAGQESSPKPPKKRKRSSTGQESTPKKKKKVKAEPE
jgi:hypothetical protein